MSRHSRSFVIGVAVTATALLGPATHALPRLGTGRPTLRLVDAWDQTLELSSVGAKPVLVVYEDKGSADQNTAFKGDLANLAKGDRYKSRVALVAVADVEGYDFWPVRGFVKDAIRGQSRRFGTVIYCDWNGGARQTLGATRGMSNVILYGKDGRVLFSHEGALSPSERREAIELLREQVDG
jgi:hypothetical protein